MITFRARRPLAVLLCASLLLASCDVVEQSAQPASPPAQVEPTQPESPPKSSAVLDDQAIGLGGVARAQSLPTPTALPGDQNLLDGYERTINNVYARNIGALVNLTDGQATGSGFLIDQEGHIITNNHVAADMREIFVTFSDRSTAQGQLIGTFAEGDIAVVKVDRLPAGVQPMTLGDSAALQVGQITVAMGSPLGLEQTVTSGIISALNRSITDISRQVSEETEQSSLQGLIQTDAAINPGNSGGPLFDSRGNVIGMNTLIATRAASSDTAGSIGLGFAVPINRVKRVARQIIESGQYRRPRMGISIRTILPQIASRANLPVSSGVMIAEVTGRPAQAAGLQGATQGISIGQGGQFPIDGDIIVAINNVAVRNTGELRNAIETQADPGDTITITFLRQGREQTTKLTLE